MSFSFDESPKFQYTDLILFRTVEEFAHARHPRSARRARGTASIQDLGSLPSSARKLCPSSLSLGLPQPGSAAKPAELRERKGDRRIPPAQIGRPHV